MMVFETCVVRICLSTGIHEVLHTWNYWWDDGILKQIMALERQQCTTRGVWLQLFGGAILRVSYSVPFQPSLRMTSGY